MIPAADLAQHLAARHATPAGPAIPLRWLHLARSTMTQAFWRDVILILETRGYRPAKNASRFAVSSAMDAARERSAVDSD